MEVCNTSPPSRANRARARKKGSLLKETHIIHGQLAFEKEEEDADETQGDRVHRGAFPDELLGSPSPKAVKSVCPRKFTPSSVE